jgi:hypothetical protein
MKNKMERNDMLVKNTKENREVRDALATLAIENMYVKKEFLEELLKVSKGEKTTEELRQEVIRKYVP